MTTWRDISNQQASAARHLAEPGFARASTSRAYYAAYSAVVHLLHAQGMTRFGDRGNPDHASVPALIVQNLAGLDATARRSIASRLRRLRMAREDADYRPHRTVDAKVRLRAVLEMNRVLELTGGAA